MLPQSRSPRVDGYINLSLFRLMGGSWIKERGIFMCSVLASVRGLKNEVYSCVARRLRDCGSSIKEHDYGTAGAAFQVRCLVGRVFCNPATNLPQKHSVKCSPCYTRCITCETLYIPRCILELSIPLGGKRKQWGVGRGVSKIKLFILPYILCKHHVLIGFHKTHLF